MMRNLVILFFLLFMVNNYSSLALAKETSTYYTEGESLGMVLGEQAWQSVGRECPKADGLLTHITDRVDEIKHISEVDGFNDYGLGIADGLIKIFGKIANHCQDQCQLIGEIAGETMAHIFCAISEKIGRPAEFRENFDIPNIICGEPYRTSCSSFLVTKAKCEYDVSSWNNSCSYNPTSSGYKNKDISMGKYWVQRLQATKMVWLCNNLFKKDRLWELTSLSRKELGYSVTICPTVSEISAGKKITEPGGEMTDEDKKQFENLLKQAEAKLSKSKECEGLIREQLAECIKTKLEEYLKKTLEERDLSGGVLMSIFYTHDIEKGYYPLFLPSSFSPPSLAIDFTGAINKRRKSQEGRGYTFCCFDFDSDKLNDSMSFFELPSNLPIKESLIMEQLEEEMKEKRTDLMVIGYADDRGGDLYNLDLAWARAKRVIDSKLCKRSSKNRKKLSVCEGSGDNSPQIIITSCGENASPDNEVQRENLLSELGNKNEDKDEVIKRRVQIFYPARAAILDEMSCISRGTEK
jgi:hypothetical protein